VSQKVLIFKLSVTLSNLNQFSKFLTAGKRMEYVTKSIRRYPPHLRHVATLYPGKLIIKIFCRYSADMEENA